MAGNNNELAFLMNLHVETSQAQQQIQKLVESARKHRMETELVIRPNLGASKREMNALEKELDQMRSRAEKAERALADLDKKGSQAFKRLKAEAPEVAKRVEEAFEKGTKEAIEDLQRLAKEMDKSSKKGASDISKNLRKVAGAASERKSTADEARLARTAAQRMEKEMSRALVPGLMRSLGSAGRDLFGQRRKAFKNMQNAQVKREEALLQKRLALSDKELEIAQERLDAANKNLRSAEKEFEQRALIGKTFDAIPVRGGDGNITGLTSLAGPDAAREVGKVLERQFGHAARLTGRQDDFQGFMRSAYAGDVEAQKAIARVMGQQNKSLQEQQAHAQKLLSNYKQEWNVQQAINKELQRQAKNQRIMQAVGQYRQQQQNRSMPIARALRGASYIIGGYGIGIGAALALREAFDTWRELEQEFAGIQGVLPSKSAVDTEIIKGGVLEGASRWGADILEAAEAARIFAQTGMDAQGVIRELDKTLMAMRGMDIAVEDMEELQIAIQAVTGEEGNTSRVLEKIARVEATYAITAQNIAETLKLATPVVNQFANGLVGLQDAFDITIGLSTAMVEQLRVTGNQAGNAIKFMLARLARPDIQRSLQEDFGLRLAQEGGRELLPLAELLDEINDRYKELQETNPAQAQRLAVQLAGGRRVNFLVAALDKYDRVLQAAEDSSLAFGDAQKRAEIRMGTISSKMERLNTQFDVFVDHLLSFTGIGDGMKNVVDALNSMLSLLSKSPITTGLGLLATIAGVGAGVRGLRGIWGAAKMAKEASAVSRFVPGGVSFAEYQAAIAQQKAGNLGFKTMAGSSVAAGATTGLASSFSKLSPIVSKVTSVFTRFMSAIGPLATIGILISGGLMASGKIRQLFDSEDKFRIELGEEFERQLFDSPQMNDFRSLVEELNLGGAERAFNRTVGTISDGESLSEVLSDRGVQSFQELLGLLEEGREEWGGLRDEIAEAFAADFGDELSGITDDAERVARAIDLISRSAFVASVRLEEVMKVIEEDSKSLLDEVRTNIGDLTDASFMEVQFVAQTQGNIQRFFRELFGEQVAQAVAHPGSMLVQTARQEAISGAEEGRRVSVRDALARAIQRIEAAAAEGDDRFREDIISAMTEGLDRQLEASSQAEDSVNRVTMGVRDAQSSAEIVESAIVEYATEALQRIRHRIEQLSEEERNARLKELDALEDIVTDPDAVRRFRLAIEGATDSLFEFTRNFRDLLVSFADQLNQIEAQRIVADAAGDEFSVEDQRLSAFRSMAEQLLTWQSEAVNQIAKIQGDRFGMQGVQSFVQAQTGMAAGDLAGMSREERNAILDEIPKQREEMRLQAEGLIESLAKLQQMRSLAELFPDTPQVRAFIEDLDLLVDSLDEEFDPNLLDGLSDRALEMVQHFARLVREQEKAEKLRELEVKRVESLVEAEKELVDLETNLLRRTEMREALEGQILDARIQQIREGDLPDAAADDKIELLRLEHEHNLLIARRRTMIEQYVQYERQARGNLENMLSGMERTLSDLNIWDSILNAEDAESRKEAVRNALVGLVEPVTSTLHDRLVENFMDAVLQQLYESEIIQDIAKMPEEMQRVNMAQSLAQTMHNDMVRAHEFGATAMYEAITSALERAEFEPGPAPQSGAEGLASAQPDLKRIGLLIGANIAGTIAGGGGKGAQIGSTVGSTAGTFLPGGPAVWGPIGGILGGFLDGDGDDERQRQQVRVLQAIEREQKETIETIERQTDELLSPESRLLNLPSTFVVPERAPGPTGGGAQPVVYEGDTFEVTVHADQNTDVDGIENAVARGIKKGRRSRPRRSRRTG